MHYALETEHQTDRENMLMQKILKSLKGERMKVHTLHIMPLIFKGSHNWKGTQMGKQTYAPISGGLYDNGQATLFFWGSHSND